LPCHYHSTNVLYPYFIHTRLSCISDYYCHCLNSSASREIVCKLRIYENYIKLSAYFELMINNNLFTHSVILHYKLVRFMPTRRIIKCSQII
jgi:hypothetical protein